jgi:hypothetical protein
VPAPGFFAPVLVQPGARSPSHPASGGVAGYRAQWSDGVTGYHYVIYRLVEGRFDYAVAVVCRVSDWPVLVTR